MDEEGQDELELGCVFGGLLDHALLNVIHIGLYGQFSLKLSIYQ